MGKYPEDGTMRFLLEQLTVALSGYAAAYANKGDKSEYDDISCRRWYAKVESVKDRIHKYIYGLKNGYAQVID